MAQNPTLLDDMVKSAAFFGKPFDRLKAASVSNGSRH
jgi:hypothetical protein